MWVEWSALKLQISNNESVAWFGGTRFNDLGKFSALSMSCGDIGSWFFVNTNGKLGGSDLGLK
jgi:hypothetical protein